MKTEQIFTIIGGNYSTLVKVKTDIDNFSGFKENQIIDFYKQNDLFYIKVPMDNKSNIRITGENPQEEKDLDEIVCNEYEYISRIKDIKDNKATIEILYYSLIQTEETLGICIDDEIKEKLQNDSKYKNKDIISLLKELYVFEQFKEKNAILVYQGISKKNLDNAFSILGEDGSLNIERQKTKKESEEEKLVIKSKSKKNNTTVISSYDSISS